MVEHLTPEVVLLIDIEAVLLVLDADVVVHPLVRPVDLALVAVQADQFAVVRSHNEPVAHLRHRRDAVGGVILITAVAQLNLHNLLVALGLGVIAVDGLLEVLHPDVLLRVDVEPLHIAVDTQFGQFPRGIALEGLRHGVVDAVVHSLAHPQAAIGSLIDTVGIVVAHRRGVALVAIVSLHSVAIVAVQAVGRADPHEAVRILEDTVHLRTRQTVWRIQTAELHIGYQVCLSHCACAKPPQHHHQKSLHTYIGF